MGMAVLMSRKPFKIYEMAGNMEGMECEEFFLEFTKLRIWVHKYHKDDLGSVLLQNGWIEKNQLKMILCQA